MHYNEVLQVYRMDLIYRDIFGPAERVEYMACRLTSDIFTKGCQHYCRVTDRSCSFMSGYFDTTKPSLQAKPPSLPSSKQASLPWTGLTLTLPPLILKFRFRLY